MISLPDVLLSCVGLVPVHYKRMIKATVLHNLVRIPLDNRIFVRLESKIQTVPPYMMVVVK